jgi:hypothetical protein
LHPTTKKAADKKAADKKAAEPAQKPPAKPSFPQESDYPKELALFTSFLIRDGYIQKVAGLIPASWRTMKEEELTALLSSKFSETQLKEMFLEKYVARVSIKARFRKVSIVTALVIGLLWARDNLEDGEWDKAAAKVAGTGLAAYVFNKLLYLRDPAAEAIMKRSVGRFGKWFQGAARTNKWVNFLARDLGQILLIWDLKDLFMSGGYEGPNIPFDLIIDVDIDNPTTWVEPDQTLLDFGFNIWYRQKCTDAHREACGGNTYLGKIEGSAVLGILKVMDIAPHEVPEIKKNLYRVEGDWDVSDFVLFSFVGRRVSASENVLVVATGNRSGLLVSGRGDYRSLEVKPANEPAVQLFGGKSPRYVPEYLLRRYSP